MQPNTAAFHFGSENIAGNPNVLEGYNNTECPINVSGEVVGNDPSNSTYTSLSGGGKRKRRSKSNRKRKTYRKKSNRKRKSNLKRKSNRKKSNRKKSNRK